MDPIRKIPKKVTKKFHGKVISRQYFHRKTGPLSKEKKMEIETVLLEIG